MSSTSAGSIAAAQTAAIGFALHFADVMLLAIALWRGVRNDWNEEQRRERALRKRMRETDSAPNRGRYSPMPKTTTRRRRQKHAMRMSALPRPAPFPAPYWLGMDLVLPPNSAAGAAMDAAQAELLLQALKKAIEGINRALAHALLHNLAQTAKHSTGGKQ